MSTTEDKLDKLSEAMKDGRPDQVAIVDRMRGTLKKAMLKKNLKEHPALLELLAVLKKREESYTILLSNKEDMTDIERRGMFERRKEVRFILSFFESADKAVTRIEKELDYQLSGEVRPVENSEDEG